MTSIQDAQTLYSSSLEAVMYHLVDMLGDRVRGYKGQNRGEGSSRR